MPEAQSLLTSAVKGSLPFLPWPLATFVGLAVTLPLVGHASWHAYRATIRMP